MLSLELQLPNDRNKHLRYRQLQLTRVDILLVINGKLKGPRIDQNMKRFVKGGIKLRACFQWEVVTFFSHWTVFVVPLDQNLLSLLNHFGNKSGLSLERFRDCCK